MKKKNKKNVGSKRYASQDVKRMVRSVGSKKYVESEVKGTLGRK